MRPSGRPLRTPPPRSFLQRNRGRLLWLAAAVGVLVLGGVAFLNATAPAFACGSQWSPSPTPSPAPGATQQLGYIQSDTGRTHVAVGTFVKYPLCPPATGSHYSASGQGPIQPGLYTPDNPPIPQNWIHNLEHGALVVLYRCSQGSDTGCSDSGQAALRQFNAGFPNSPICNLPAGNISPVIARFDQMNWPYAALVWGVVLPLDRFDSTQVLAFFNQRAERTNPEKLCAAPTATPAPAASPTTSPAASGSPAPTATPAPAASPTPAASASPAAS